MSKVTRIEAVDLQGVGVLEEGIAPIIAAMSDDDPGPSPIPPTGTDTLPG